LNSEYLPLNNDNAVQNNDCTNDNNDIEASSIDSDYFQDANDDVNDNSNSSAPRLVPSSIVVTGEAVASETSNPATVMMSKRRHVDSPESPPDAKRRKVLPKGSPTDTKPLTNREE
jgi:hypothetical protein